MTLIMKAVEFDKLPVGFKKTHGSAQALVDKGWWVQPKYDGCFGMAVLRPYDESRMLSRTGEDYSASCGHILAALEAAAAKVYGPEWQEFVVLGEVYQPETPFPVISGNFRRQRPSPELVFVVCDVLPITLNTETAYTDRLARAWAIARANPVPELWFVNTFKNGSVQCGVGEYAQRLVTSGGYDGAIIRDPLAGYSVGMVKKGEIVKVKPTLSLDLEVTAWAVDKGEKTGRDVFTIFVKYKGVTTTVGSGVPHKFEDVPKPGQIAEIECIGITEDGKLREPRFKGIRFDKEAPDS